VKNVAKKHGMIATMMPKPIALDNGSGMHVNVSLWRENKNLFFDANDKYAEISDIARYFGGGGVRPRSCACRYSCSNYKFIPSFQDMEPPSTSHGVLETDQPLLGSLPTIR
jgi:glutamine synthetase